MLIVVVEGGAAIKNHPMNKAAYGRIRGHNFFLAFWTFLYGMKWLKIARLLDSIITSHV